jgi:predicted regulator of Ras-like GTPase activity (Roadblock/LC7/MglB family)
MLVRSRPPKGAAPERDQRETAFTGILADLVRRVPGAHAAALVDRDGETVDYAGDGAPYETRVAAAHWRIALGATREQASFADVKSLVIRAHRASFIVHALPEGYALLVRLVRGAGFRGWQRAVPVCARRIAREAGWPETVGATWFDVDVSCDAEGRPCAVMCAGAADRVEVIGRHRRDPTQPEPAWRVRLSSGAEVTFVCESRRFWYADEAPAALVPSERPKNI